MPSATVKEFDPTKGFGTLTLDTGEEIPFDIAAANKREPKPNDRAEVTLGVGWKGKPKAKLVVFEREADPVIPFAHAVEQLHAFGFLRQWDVKQAQAAANQIWDGEDGAEIARSDAAQLLDRYYGERLGERGRAEGVITHNRRFHLVTEAVVKDVCALCNERVTVPHGPLPQVLLAINAVLVERNSRSRLFMLDAGLDFYVIACRPIDFEAQIATSSWLKLG